jgi:hypothetical protein
VTAGGPNFALHCQELPKLDCERGERITQKRCLPLAAMAAQPPCLFVITSVYA